MEYRLDCSPVRGQSSRSNSSFMSPASKLHVLTSATAEALSSAIADIGRASFPAALLRVIESYCSFDCALITLYSAQRRPDILIDRLSHERRENTAKHYIEGAYLLDPFYNRAKEAKAPMLLRMLDIAPQDFDTSDYFVSYYKQSNVVDELNYLIPLDEGRVLAVSLERSSQQQPFSSSEIAACAAYLPIVAALVGKHVEMPDVLLPANASDAEHERLEGILSNFGADVLTPRECQTVNLMLNGYSASAIAGLLGVSIETVRVHRRHIYGKLKISSLAELFSLALRAIYSRQVK